MTTSTIEPTTLQKVFSETDVMSVTDFINYNLNASTKETERLFFYKTFTSETYEHIVTLREHLRRNIKNHARLLSTHKQAFRSGQSSIDYFSKEYKEVLNTNRFLKNSIDGCTIDEMKRSFRIAHILLSILNGNRMFEIENKTDMDEYSYVYLKGDVMKAFTNFKNKFPWMESI